MFDYSKLNGRIREVCGSQAKFAQKLGISQHSLSMKLNGKNKFKQDEIMRSVEVLGLNIRDIPDYFFAA